MAEVRTPEEKKRIVENCIDIEMSGGSVLDYLRAEGYVSPRATWVNFQKRYLCRSDAQHSITDGKATGKKRKGKRPAIREEALEQDRMDFERAKEDAANTVVYGGKEYEKAPATTCFASFPAEAPHEPPEECEKPCQDEEKPAETQELVALKLKSASGYWEVISDEGMIQFWADREGGFTALRLTADEWRRVIGEFPEVCRMMGIA